ncbi:37490_t:CDS:2 [Gigaspora margarita]|uniref:37490_t:CDS:1 n=1 Tax=Gigaspora margarita TaxID=4874 RepID=A0ABN7UYL0_GIGMA|nr:37490_t:CDS:2 [Gigaspora margarita]
MSKTNKLDDHTTFDTNNHIITCTKPTSLMIIQFSILKNLLIDVKEPDFRNDNFSR